MIRKRQSHRGRPTTAATPGKKSTVSVRLTAETKTQIDKAAKANDRPFSQEAELRLEQTFRGAGLLGDIMSLAFGTPWAAILGAAGKVSRMAGPFEPYKVEMRDRHVYISSDWKENDPSLRAVILMLRVINEPSSELAKALSSNPIPKWAFDQEGEVECGAVAVAVQLLRGDRDTSDRDWTEIRSALPTLVDELQKNAQSKKPHEVTDHAR